MRLRLSGLKLSPCLSRRKSDGKPDEKVFKTTREPVKIVYDGEVATVSASDRQSVSSDGDSTGRQAKQPDVDAPQQDRKPAKLNAPLPVVLTRYAAQNMYGPLRTVEPVPGISPVSLKLPSAVTTLMPSEPVSVTPMAAWSLQGSSVVALQVRNRSAGKVILDPRALEGQFITATFQHRWLGRAGTPEDTTVLYLVTSGRPEGAFIAEPPSQQPADSRKRRKK